MKINACSFVFIALVFLTACSRIPSKPTCSDTLFGQNFDEFIQNTRQDMIQDRANGKLSGDDGRKALKTFDEAFGGEYLKHPFLGNMKKVSPCEREQLAYLRTILVSEIESAAGITQSSAATVDAASLNSRQMEHPSPTATPCTPAGKTLASIIVNASGYPICETGMGRSGLRFDSRTTDELVQQTESHQGKISDLKEKYRQGVQVFEERLKNVETDFREQAKWSMRPKPVAQRVQQLTCARAQAQFFLDNIDRAHQHACHPTGSDFSPLITDTKQPGDEPPKRAESEALALDGVTGQIGPYKIVLTLSESQGRVTGSYRYANKTVSLRLEGEKSDTGLYTIREFDPAGKQTGTFSFTQNSGSIRGTWKSPNNKLYDFSLANNP